MMVVGLVVVVRRVGWQRFNLLHRDLVVMMLVVRMLMVLVVLSSSVLMTVGRLLHDLLLLVKCDSFGEILKSGTAARESI